jgi:pimeloyl-ACP methyl ester carboxylesterase
LPFWSGGPADGYPLLLLHGWPDDPYGWTKVTPHLEAAGYRWIAPWLRGFGATHFIGAEVLRDGSAVALAQDALDLADALRLERFAAVGHDWGGRAAYALAVIAPSRVSAIAVLSIAYSPRGAFTVPAYDQCRRWWYQWLMTSEAGAAKVAGDPVHRSEPSSRRLRS